MALRTSYYFNLNLFSFEMSYFPPECKNIHSYCLVITADTAAVFSPWPSQTAEEPPGPGAHQEVPDTKFHSPASSHKVQTETASGC